MKAVIYIQLLAYVYISHAVLPTGDALLKILQDTYHNVDANQDGLIQREELAGFPVHADRNHDGCMTLAEYKMVTSGTAETATNVFRNLDPDNSDCLTHDKISRQFDILDRDKNGDGDFQEFSHWFTNLIFGHPVNVVG